ncbi:ribonuclease H-like domain-containing protein [Aspergillus varians]
MVEAMVMALASMDAAEMDVGKVAINIIKRSSTLNGAVEEKENAIDSLLHADARCAADASLPTRPGFGTRGAQVILYANYFQLSTPTGSEVLRYNVEIPQGNGIRKQRQIFNLLLNQHFLEKRDYLAADFRSTLICAVDLLQGNLEQVYDVRYKGELQSEYPEKAAVYPVKVIFTGKVSISDLLDYMSSTNVGSMFRGKSEVLEALNIIVGHHAQASSQLASRAANTHFAICGGSAERFNLGAGLEALRGFSVSVRAATARLLVNCQVEYAVFFQHAELAKVIAAYRQDESPSVSRLEAFLRRLQVQITHIPHRPRFKIIVGLASPSDGEALPHPPLVAGYGAGPREVQFWRLDPDPKPIEQNEAAITNSVRSGCQRPGRYITIEDLFLEKYGLALDPNIPVIKVLSNHKHPCYLPAEVCVVRTAQPTRSRISGGQSLKLLDFAIRNPAANARSITTKGAEVVGISSGLNTTLQNFGFHISSNLVTVPGRVLPSPSVLYANKSKADMMSGTWKQKNAKFFKPCQISSWAFLYIVCARDREYFPTPAELKPCIAALRSKLNEYGVNTQPISDGHRLDVTPTFSHGKYDAAKLDQSLGAAISRLMIIRKPELVLVILPSTHTDIYNSVKRVCDVQIGISNICALAAKLFKQNDAYIANLCLKVNLKLGGVNQVLGTEKPGIISEGKTMVVGIHATHTSTLPAAGDVPAVVGMVASVDKHLAQWPADIEIESPHHKKVAPLDKMLESRLQFWASVNRQQLPENIVVYRGGISDGEYALVVKDEVPLLKSACENIYPQSEKNKGFPRLSVIVVGKRHRTRFYPTREGDADKLSNPRNGTVVDRGVTEARDWDFYLQAHAPLHGTARPAHYYVAWDEVFRARKLQLPLVNSADAVEDFTHDLCYLFGRTNKAVSVCPPAYYADLVCGRGRCYLKHIPGVLVPGNCPAEEAIEMSKGGQMVNFTDIKVHPALQKTMFYI